MWNLKRNYTIVLTYKTNRLTDLEDELTASKGEGQGEGMVREFGVNMYTLLYLE